MSIEQIIEDYINNFDTLLKSRLGESSLLIAKYMHKTKVKHGLDETQLSYDEFSNIISELPTRQEQIQFSIHYIAYQHYLSNFDTESPWLDYMSFLEQNEASVFTAGIKNQNPFILKIHTFNLIKAINIISQMQSGALAYNQKVVSSKPVLLERLMAVFQVFKSKLPECMGLSSLSFFIQSLILATLKGNLSSFTSHVGVKNIQIRMLEQSIEQLDEAAVLRHDTTKKITSLLAGVRVDQPEVYTKLAR